MNWIKSNEREPSTEGKYHCKYNGVKVVLNFVKIQPAVSAADILIPSLRMFLLAFKSLSNLVLVIFKLF
jgi:hypothetical protein